jgi:hypothetical protein
MRYYVLCDSEIDGIEPHIIAEVVRDRTDPSKATTLAAALADEHRVIVSREELLAHPVGLQALKAWDAEDDSRYDCVSDAIRTEVARERPGLRLVPALDR